MVSCISTLLPVTSPTPIFSSLGGIILAISTITLLAFNGKLLGLSGMFEGLIFPDKNLQWKAAFVATFMATAQFLAYFTPEFLDQNDLGCSWGVILFGGFLVGFGTRLSNGCTSGHGICGLARLSSRSIAAVVIFLTTAIATATSLDTVAWVHTGTGDWDIPQIWVSSCFSAFIVALISGAFYKNLKYSARLFSSIFSGCLFCCGIVLAGMGKRAKILNFLVFKAGWDYSLLFILGFAVIICFVMFRVILNHLERPILCELREQLKQNKVMIDEDIRPSGTVIRIKSKCEKEEDDPEEVVDRIQKAVQNHKVDLGSFDGCTFGIPTCTTIDLKLVLGSWCFGLGWGLTGLCPGPAMILAAVGYPKIALGFLPMMAIGMFAARYTKNTIIPRVFTQDTNNHPGKDYGSVLEEKTQTEEIPRGQRK